MLVNYSDSKITKILILLFFVLALINCEKKKPPIREFSITSFSQIQKYFQNPPSEYRTAPFMVWNGIVTKEKIDYQLKDLKAQGIGGVFIHPRWGLITPYLTNEWFDLVRYTVERGKEFGLKVWLYDENSFPSGFAGGLVPAAMPESYNQGQGLILHEMDTLRLDENKKYLYVFQEINQKYIDVTQRIESLKNQPGKFFAFELAFNQPLKRLGGYPYVDLLVSGTTEKFIEITMPGYQKAVGDEFGLTVPGIFTDEPHIHPPRGNNCIRWTPDLFKFFQKKWGYDLKTHLVSLFKEVGDWKRLRHNYYATLLDMFIERWSKPWFKYCEEHRLKWTGHYWEHVWPNPSHGPDHMAMYAWHQMPGIDMLFNTWEGRPDQFGNIRAVKELRSVANQMGRQRTLSETYGASGWELTFEDMKRNGDWEYVLGVNFMNQHLSYMDIFGDRKHDYPQSFSYHNPCWKFYKVLGNYYARLSLVLSAGQQLNDVLVIEPTTTAWMYYSSVTSHPRFNQIKSDFHKFLERLEKYQFEYDLGSEYIIQNFGKVIDDKFVVNKKSYSLVVLPPGLENLNQSTANLIGKFLKNGGKVLSLVEPPAFIDGHPDEMLRKFAKQFQQQWISAKSLEDSVCQKVLKPNNIQFIHPESISGKLFHQRRILEDGQLVFLVNSSLTDYTAGRFRIKGKSLLMLDPLDGEIFQYPSVSKNGYMEIDFNLPPVGSLLLFASQTEQDAPRLPTYNAGVKIQPTSKLQILRLEPNSLVLDYCDIIFPDGSKENGIYFYDATRKAFQKHGFEENPWSVSVQFKTEIVDRDTFAANTGFEARFHFLIDPSFKNRKSLRAVVEQPQLWRVMINGKIVQPIPDEWWLDRTFGVFDIGEYVVNGDNILSLSVSPMSVFAELEPVYLIGDFCVEPAERGWKIVSAYPLKLGSWKHQGLPLYTNGVSYSKQFKIDDLTKHYFVKLNQWKGTVAAIRVNGREAGIIGWPPYELDITRFVRKGENQIDVRVYGSLKNLLGPHHGVKQHGIVTPWIWRYAPKIQPPGDQYDLIDYGLFEDFVVLQRNQLQGKKING